MSYNPYIKYARVIDDTYNLLVQIPRIRPSLSVNVKYDIEWSSVQIVAILQRLRHIQKLNPVFETDMYSRLGDATSIYRLIPGTNEAFFLFNTDGFLILKVSRTLCDHQVSIQAKLKQRASTISVASEFNRFSFIDFEE